MWALLPILNKTKYLVFFALFFATTTLSGFSFQEAELEDQVEEEQRQELIGQLISTLCSKKLKNKKIAVIIGEKHHAKYTHNTKNTQVSRILNEYLKELGLKTYSQSQIKQQIANAEVKAYLSGDPDTALNVARRLAANFLLKGIVRIQEGVNKSINVNEVSVNIYFTLTNSKGRTISTIDIQDASYASSDTYGMAIQLVKEQGRLAVAKLYHAYCNSNHWSNK